MTKDNEVFIHQLSVTGHPYIKDVAIDCQGEKQHIIITGKNGSGKSTFLDEVKRRVSIQFNEIRKVIRSRSDINSIRQRYANALSQYNSSTEPLTKKSLHTKVQSRLASVNRYTTFCDLSFNNRTAIDLLQGNAAVQAFFNAKRTTTLEDVSAISATDIEPQAIDKPLSPNFKQHLVNSRSQLSFAKDEGDQQDIDNLSHWFKQLDLFMSDIFDCEIKLTFDRKALDYKIESDDGRLLDFNQLSEGYGAIINIVSEIIMRMEAIENGNFTLPGIVLIDEVETHLHVSLQKKILPLLTRFFPNIQFIVTTHSPFVLTSLDDAIVFDMDSNSQINAKEDLWQLSYEDIVEGYFDTEPFSLALEQKMSRYETLHRKDKSSLTVAENKELLLLGRELNDVPTFKLADIELRLRALGLKK